MFIHHDPHLHLLLPVQHMTREDIIKLAREAGINGPAPARQGFKMYANPDRLERFAALVAAAGREACAAMLDENAMACENPIYRSLLQANAQAIREMGQP